MAIGLDRLVVLERTEQTTKLYEIELGGRDQHRRHPMGRRRDAPSLEADRRRGCEDHAGAKDACGSTPPNFPDIVGKTEGMALLGDGALALINDDDFGIAGGRTQIVVLRGTGIARR